MALVGFMGAGKSTVGPLLARRLGCSFADLDELIAAREGRSIPRIFDEHGEVAFRAAERAALVAHVAGPPSVLATGGGCPVQPGALELLQRWGTVVFLDVPLGVLRQRVQGEGRPLWDEGVAQRHHARRPVYLQADIVVDAARPVSAVVETIVEELSP